MTRPFGILILASEVIAAVMLDGTAIAACSALPYPSFANGTSISANQLMANLNSLSSCQYSGAGGSQNGIQYNSGAGQLSGIAPLTNGQLVIGSTGGAPQAGTVTAGTGVAIGAGPGTLAIATTDNGAAYYREFGAYAPPSASSFTFADSPKAGITPTVSNISNVGLIYSVGVNNDVEAYPGVYRAIPTLATWTLTVRAEVTSLPGQRSGDPPGTPNFGIWVQDTSGKMVGLIIVNVGYSQDDGNNVAYVDVGHVASHYANPDDLGTDHLPISDPPSWFRVQYANSNLIFSISWDSQNWVTVHTESQNNYLNGTLKYIGVGGNVSSSIGTYFGSYGTTGATITYWDIDDDPASTRHVQ